MPLPVTVISELLGVPPQDQAKFARWSGALIRAGQSAVSAMLALPEIFAFLRYAKKLIQSKRTAPADDLVSSLVASEAEGDRLDGEELLAMVGILLSAGHETTVNLIGNGMLALIDNPDAMMQLQEQPDHVEAAVEELLRFASPIAASTHRYARQDIEISGSIIPKGSLVFGLIASANRDPRQFEGADKIDFARKPNRHLTFGEGGHYCVGAALARMEGAVAFSDILSHMPNLRLAVPRDKLRWRPGMVLTGLERCPLVR
jgi:cytochrome P450